MNTTELARELGQDLRELPAGTLAQYAFEADISGDPDAADLFKIAAEAYRKERGL